MFSVIDRYIARELIKSWLAIVVVLLLSLFTHAYVKVLRLVAEGGISGDVIMKLVGLQLVLVAGHNIIPTAFFLSVLFVLGRMYRDSEIVALSACGVGLKRITRSIFAAAVPIAMLTAWLVMSVAPWSRVLSFNIIAEQRERTEFSSLRPSQFQEFAGGSLVLFAGDSDDDGRLRDLFIQHRTDEGVTLVTAEQGRLQADAASGERWVVLENGHRYQGSPGQEDHSVGQFARYSVRIPQPKRDWLYIPLKGRPTHELLVSDDLSARTEWQRRLSFPLSVLALSLLAVPLSRARPRESVLGRIILSLLIYFVFVNLQRTAEHWMEAAVTPAWLGMWWVPLSMSLLAVVLMLRDAGWLTMQRYRRRW